MNNELSYADRTKIVKDWAAQFPEMVIDRKRMTIWKRIGPLLTYICVYTKKDSLPSYHPQWAIHRLYEKMPGPGSMALRYGRKWIHYRIDRLPGNWSNWTLDKQQEHIESNNSFYTRVDTHYDYYLEAADDIRKNSWIKTEGEVTLDEIWQGAENFIKHSFNRNACYISNYETTIPIYTAIWAGELDKAREYLKNWENWKVIFADRRPSIERVFTEKPKYSSLSLTKMWGSTQDYKEQILHFMNYPKELRQIVKDEVIAHKLEKVPYQNIDGVRYRE